MKPLLPDRHLNYDLFICDVLDAIPKDDMTSMEHPVFSLSTKPDMRHLRYEHNGSTLEIIPSGYGLATIHDKDVLIYVISQIVAKMKRGNSLSKTVRLTAHELLIATNRPTDGHAYRRLKDAFVRLRGTTIKTDIRTNGMRITEGFGLIDKFRIVEKSPVDERMVAVEITLSDWLYNAVCANEVLTLHRDYFRLRKPIDRRIYELARKHCGEQPSWKIGLGTLHKKIGSTAPIRKLRGPLLELTATDHLPDYSVSLSDDDIVTFTSRRRVACAGRQSRLPLLMTETFEKAKRAAPGWDVYAIEREWREWSAGKVPPHTPDAAFIAFCRQKFRRHGSP